MKKLIRSILSIALAILLVHNPNVLAVPKRQPQKKQQRQSSLRQQKNTQKQLPQQKTPAVKKQEQQLGQQIKQDTKALQEAVDKKKQATTPQEKKQADQDVIEISQTLFDKLKERSILEDVWSGYSPTQIKNAKAKIKLLEDARLIVKQNIVKLNSRLKLITITTKGWIWDSTTAKPGNEKEYAALNTKLTEQKDNLAKIERNIRNQSVVAGEQWANTYRILVAGGLAGTVYYGPVAAFNTAMAAKQQLGLARMGFGAAQMAYKAAAETYENIYNDPSATPEAKAQAKADLDAQKARIDKYKEQIEKEQAAKQKK